ncbi:UNVERIFIED_CONTAM: hypothetical protein Scaly_2041900 [Sesamum calycinum]|uniref:Uncharacterized protein n=1 Tax=Sesamum calycinum TaxID=2727403 RepID=A0AAW2N3A8_9LAMI
MATGETPFCLVHDTKEIIPAEIEEETKRISQYDPASKREGRFFDLTAMEERRDHAYAQRLHHKSLMIRSYKRKVRPRHFRVGDLVLKKVEVLKHVGKLDIAWEGPYKVVEIKKRGT